MSSGSTKVVHVTQLSTTNGARLDWVAMDTTSTYRTATQNGQRKSRKPCQPITTVSGRAYPDILHTSTGHVFASAQPERTPAKLKDELQFGTVGGSSARGFHLAEQTFEQIRDDCLKSGRLYEDPDFPAIESSLFWFSRTPVPITWKRPSEINSDPCMFREQANQFDVIQGQLGDCWLMAAMADLACRPNLFARVVPNDQGFSKEDKYCGAFHFKFWRFGRWVDVVVDDRLPTYQAKLVYTHSADLQEFWPALMEKAYAKVNGCYENLDGGTASEAMEDLTGGIAEHYELERPPPNLRQITQQSFKLGALLSSAIMAGDLQREGRLTNGLVLGHAYSLVDVREIPVDVIRGQNVTTILKARNPWGQVEWNGKFSDKSEIWKKVPQKIRDELKYVAAEDGAFWLDYEDFSSNYKLLEICNIGPEAFLINDDPTGESAKTQWQTNVFEGAWTKGVTAGGCRNNVDTFYMNPQYRMVISTSDNDKDGLATCIIALMQKDRRKMRIRGDKNLPIGYGIYSLKDPKSSATPLPREYFLYNSSVAKSPVFMNTREVVTRFRMPPGTYVIIPSTFDPNQEGAFLLRVYTEVESTMHEHDVHGMEQVKPLTVVPAKLRDAKLDGEALDQFSQVADDQFSICAVRFTQLLNKLLGTDNKGSPLFSKDTARTLLVLSDVHQTGKMDTESFMQLLQTVRYWKKYFDKYDIQRLGIAKLADLRSMFDELGCRVNNHILRVLALRYGEDDHLTISLQNFILATVRLQQMMNLYRTKDPQLAGSATFSLEEWIVNTMYT